MNVQCAANYIFYKENQKLVADLAGPSCHFLEMFQLDGDAVVGSNAFSKMLIWRGQLGNIAFQ